MASESEKRLTATQATDEDKQYIAQTSIKTSSNLKTVIRAIPELPELSHLTLPKIEAISDLVGQLIPAGNVPGLILSGAARLKEHVPPLKTVKRDVDLLFKGVEQVFDKATYWGIFGGAAAVIWGYQNILKLAGKDPNDAFPRGTWQFYVDYALREDTARHSTETYGFDYKLERGQIQLSAVDRITAWVMATTRCLAQYEALLQNEWRERVYTYLLREATVDLSDAGRYARVYRDWLKHRPYGRGPDTNPKDNYPVYRRKKFDQYLSEIAKNLPPTERHNWDAWMSEVKEHTLEDYLDQMSILAYLEPETYSEVHQPITFHEAYIGIIYAGQYHLIQTSELDTGRPASIEVVRAQVAALLERPPSGPPAQLAELACVKRSALAGLRKKLPSSLVVALDKLRYAPILLNFDTSLRGSHDPLLSKIRQAERGIGSHALTIFDTGHTFVFDMSHIFFDGVWGTALAEILTNEALSWAAYLHTLPATQPAAVPPSALDCRLTPDALKIVRQAPHVTPEAGAELPRKRLDVLTKELSPQADGSDWDTRSLMPGLNKLRSLFKQRNDLVQLTVNDLLVLYRAMHAVTYHPSPHLVAELHSLTRERATREAAKIALNAIEQESRINPAVLIPVDGSWRSPRERLYPMTFTVPLNELDLLNLYDQTVQALDAYRKGNGNRTALYEEFDRLQRTLLATLAGFGRVLSKAKEIAIRGESASVGTIKLLAHFPAPIQRMLDAVPGRFDLLNDILKGREVFSNVGAVKKGSTLRRFITAKDDNDKKSLAWGVLSYIPRNAQEEIEKEYIMHISLRDFRPHVALLQAIGRNDLSQWITQDYLETYVRGMNEFVANLRRIAVASRETRLTKLGD